MERGLYVVVGPYVAVEAKVPVIGGISAIIEIMFSLLHFCCEDLSPTYSPWQFTKRPMTNWASIRRKSNVQYSSTTAASILV